VERGATVEISGLTIAHGSLSVATDYDRGGGIFNFGTLTVNDCAFMDNSAIEGGAIGNVGTLTVNSSVLSGNLADGGGAIYNDGMLVVANSSLSGNRSRYQGIAIDSRGPFTITNTTISNNVAPSSAVGVIYSGPPSVIAAISNCTISDNTSGEGCIVSLGNLTVSDSTISSNTAKGPESGAGIFNSGTLVVSNSTIAANTATDPDSAGGVLNHGSLTVSNSTITGNTNTFTGIGGTTAGGIANLALPNRDATAVILNSTIAINAVLATNQTGSQLVSGHRSGTSTATVTLVNSIVSSDGSRPNSYALPGGTFVSQGHNLSNDDGGGFLTGPGDLINTDPLLGPLQDNGGPTQTMALLPGSPAVDAGDNTAAPAFDQRGLQRIVGGAVDIGAFEAQIGAATHLVVSTPAQVTSSSSFDVTVTAVDAYGHTATGYVGTMMFTSSDIDLGVTLPSDYTFTAVDQGVHTFAGEVTLITLGSQTLTVTDTADNTITSSAAVTVGP
jgi:hypothetical protein